ncbi:hypothetical protein SKAU_G00127820 [Synaphobranchus kaupii]|uniref:Uncharacterized protein n=1 Tax=Synaphobranchus kaupii TaxID=118154 RepID=A0A9Q1J2P4_SYNKA|nr:hypothetical protein SKAU_G00127820 [Synaphobranchus kaupii]
MRSVWTRSIGGPHWIMDPTSASWFQHTLKPQQTLQIPNFNDTDAIINNLLVCFFLFFFLFVWCLVFQSRLELMFISLAPSHLIKFMKTVQCQAHVCCIPVSNVRSWAITFPQLTSE